MRPRTVLVLLILVVGLVAFIELYEGELPSSDERAVLARRVLPLEPTQVKAVELRRGEDSVVLRRLDDGGDDAGWRLVEPLEGPADGDKVNALIDDLVELEKLRTLEDAVPADVGLEPPRLIVVLQTSSGDHRLDIGSQLPAAESMVVASGSPPELHVVADRVWSDLSREPAEWRRRSVFALTRDRIRALSLQQETDSRVELVSREGDFWLEQPFSDRADSDRVDELLAAIVSLQVDGFIDEPLSDSRRRELGLEPHAPRLEIEVDGKPEALWLVWGAADSEDDELHYAEVESQVFTTRAKLGDFFNTKPQQWRSKAVVALETFEIDTVQIDQSGEESMTLERAGADWRRNGEIVSFPTVSELLYGLTEMRAADFIDTGTGGSRASGAQEFESLEVSLRGRDRSQELRFERFETDMIVAKDAGRGVGLLLASDQFTELLGKMDAVRAADPLRAPDDEQQSDSSTSLTDD